MHVQGEHGLPVRAEREDNFDSFGKRGNLSVDSTGFSSKHRFDRWIDTKDRKEKARGYLKAHVACFDDGFVPSVRITGPYVHDGTRLISLVRNVTDVSSVRADGAYAWRVNAQFIKDIGATPYLRFRKDAIGWSKGYPAWRTMKLKYNLDRVSSMARRISEEMDGGEHVLFCEVKRRLGSYVSSRRSDLQRKELVMKFIVHNLILISRRG